MESPPTNSPAPTARPDPRMLSQRLGRHLVRRQTPANTCGWELGKSYLPLQCPGKVCAFDHVRNLFGCCAFDQPCEVPGTCIEYSSYASPSCSTAGSCSPSTYADATVCSNPNTPYCVTLSYDSTDSTGDMMQMYTCVTSQSQRAVYSYYYTISPHVAAILADTKTVTPTNITSVATVMVRSFASAALPTTSISMATSSTDVNSAALALPTTSTAAASPSRADPSSAPSNAASTIAVIVLGALVGLALLAFVLWRWHRRQVNKCVGATSAPRGSDEASSTSLGGKSSSSSDTSLAAPADFVQPPSRAARSAESLTDHGRPDLKMTGVASESPHVNVAEWQRGLILSSVKLSG